LPNDIIHSSSLPGETEGRARESGGDDVDSFDGGPVAGEEVSMILDSRVVGFEDNRTVRIGLREPDPLDAERPSQAEIEAAA
jgi:hypothetical protein